MSEAVSVTATSAAIPPSLAERLPPVGRWLWAGVVNLAPLAVMLILIGVVWQFATDRARGV